jgi:hypothetical protein
VSQNTAGTWIRVEREMRSPARGGKRFFALRPSGILTCGFHQKTFDPSEFF